MTLQLSNRLQAIAMQVPAGSRLADIGSDHALLPVYLTMRGTAAFAIAGELNQGPYEAAKQQIDQAGVGQRVEARKGDGLTVVQPGEVDVVTIAGMGGSLMAQILEAGVNKLDGVSRLVLQPNVAEDAVRHWLVRHHWFLTDEHILEEDGKIYEILVAEKMPGAQQANSLLYADFEIGEGIETDCQGAGSVPCAKVPGALLYKLGPYLLKKAEPVFFAKWQSELEKLGMICRQLEQSASPASKRKLQQLQQSSRVIKEVLACLQKDKR